MGDAVAFRRFKEAQSGLVVVEVFGVVTDDRLEVGFHYGESLPEARERGEDLDEGDGVGGCRHDQAAS